MYCISETQIDFILDDIRARGIGIESLQQNLLDHICCVIEQDLDENGDFEGFYLSAISTFYKVDLKEIEEETIHLLTNKNYYIMKKVMIASGALSAALLSIGIFLKFMHLPGAAVTILCGVLLLSFIFLPLMFTLRVKEKQENRDKVVAGIGTLAAMLIAVGILFKIMHWPGANVLCILALGIMIVLFVPIYFFSGIRNPQTKVNTIVSSVLLIAGCSLILVLIRSPHGSRMQYVSDTDYFLRNEQIVKTEARQLAQIEKGNINGSFEEAGEISKICSELKAFLLKRETGFESIGSDFESKEAWISDTMISEYFGNAPQEEQKLNSLKKLIQDYNAKGKTTNLQLIPIATSLFGNDVRIRTALNDLIQIQMVVLQNQRELLASN